MTSIDLEATTIADRINDTLRREEGDLAKPSPAAQAGPTSPRYEVFGTLGEGGMGKILAARDLQFGRVVALKELHREALSSQTLRRFLLESLVTGNLEHPGIVAVYERGVREGMPYYTMRRLEGQTFADALRRAGTSAERLRLLPTLVQCAHTVGFAHDRGVVHRDIKPENILLGHHGEALVIDWGLARVRSLRDLAPAETTEVLESAAAGARTVHGSVLGTPAYMAPEQARGALDLIDERTDVFALGAVLYAVLTGRPLYQGATRAELLVLAAGRSFVPLANAAPGAPRMLAEVCEKALSLRPEDRFPHAGAFARALEAVQAEALEQQEPRAVKVLSWAIGASLLALLVAVGVVSTHWISALGNQGRGGPAVLGLTLLGMSLASLDAATKGRHRLSQLGAAVACVTLLLGAALSGVGVSICLRTLDDSDLRTNSVAWRDELVHGVYNALGLFVRTCLGTAFQVSGLVLARLFILRSR
ncbi:MAG: serine/threonine protein kinase [Deltaproteobacteria bacterium]|nr:serine/threonine protein kinase [Deltaproteobacteria bacterium]